ncbi:MAG: pyruvate carboxylase [Clostridiales bacterium]|nr:pyruvate carboxylase [Clostridiales bacterium]
MADIQRFKRVLVANRGEIAIRVFRACKELGIRTVAIYSEQDKESLFRVKADEAYLIGKGKTPVGAYLDMEEIIKLAKAKGVDAIHPGYGFLAENADFADMCAANGIEFIGPTGDMMNSLGDKIQSKIVAESVNVPTIPGVEKAIESEEEALKIAAQIGYPVMLKAAAGGGGRGMRVVREEGKLIDEYKRAKSEAGKAFGNDTMFIEKYIENPKHIEVQLLGDKYGNIVHLFERDCSIQRRHQKVIEFTPSLKLTEEQREAICADAIKIARAVNYRSAGTVEFLVDQSGEHYFIEMNPRIQVEHTVSELITGIDLVQSQILVAEGYALDSEEVGIPSQEAITRRGYAIQCRITTEDPANNFFPDTGKLSLYRSAGGFGIRLDGGNGFTGSEITPYYDSLLVKVSSYGLTFDAARRKAIRALRETQIAGVKTNVGFLLNVLHHPNFKDGVCDTGFIEKHPELVKNDPGSDAERMVLKHIGDITINHNKGVKPQFNVPAFPRIPQEELDKLSGTKQMLNEHGPDYVKQWILDQQKLLITDTTMRSAQQTLMAGMMRTVDMTKIAPAVATYGKDLFSVEMWGGSTFGTAYRKLTEDPWKRLDALRKKIPNIMLQMLMRGSNALGYKYAPDNAVRELIKQSAEGGIDVFRIFDSMNWVPGMEVAIDEVRKQNKIAEASICYSGDILDPGCKYTLQYYIDLAKQLESLGAHIIGIEDMAGVLNPMAASTLISALKSELNTPIHLHTHDISGNGVATALIAATAGVDILDLAINSMAGQVSDPALNTIVAALRNTPRDTGIDVDGMQVISDYWADVRPVYKDFETSQEAVNEEIHKYGIPCDLYYYLREQAEAAGLLSHEFSSVKEMYKTAGEMLGDIIKVTPSSGMVASLAIFMVSNGLTPENILEKGQSLAFPQPVVDFFQGMMGQPMGGFPEELRKVVLKDTAPIDVRPGDVLPPEDFDHIKSGLRKYFGLAGTGREVIGYAMYPQVFEEYMRDLKQDGDLSRMGSDIYFYGLSLGETCQVKVSDDQELTITLLEIREPDENGYRDLLFEVNGHTTLIKIADESVVSAAFEDAPAFSGGIPGQLY